MTNEEAVERLKYAHFHFRNEINEVEIKSIVGTDELAEFDFAINSIQENTKLKAENEQWQSTNLELVCELTRIECENHQLKAEIEQLKEDSKIVAKELVSQIREIEQLKSELEQSVKLPCKVGNTIYVNLPYQKPRNSYLREVIGFRYIDNSWFIETEESDYSFHQIGNSVFLTREEAEQSLKDKINSKQLEARIDADNVKKEFKEFCDNRDKEEIKFREVE